MGKRCIIVVLLLLFTLEVPTVPMLRKSFLPIALANYRLPAPSSKRGLGTHHPERCDDGEALAAAWRYDWQSDIGMCAGVESVPMVYSPRQVRRPFVCPTGGDSPYLLGFNEPDIPSQANIAPAAAVETWLLIEQACPDRLLVSPAPSQLRPEWLAEFRAAFITQTGREPGWHALAIHCYFANAARCKAIVRQVVGYAEAWGVPGDVWVTEFAPVGDVSVDSQAMAEAAEFLRWLEDNPAVARYAWFPTRLEGNEFPGADSAVWNVLVDEMGPTQWGELYREGGR